MQQSESRLVVAGRKTDGMVSRGLFTPEEVRAVYGCLRGAYARGDLERQRYEHMLEALKFVDVHGRVWSIGTKTGGWYYNFNFQWYPGEPYSMLTRMDSSSPTCLHCGNDTPSRTAVYCIICGRPLATLPARNTLVVDAGTAKVPEGRLRRRLSLTCLALALLAAAFLVYMYVSGTMLYAGFGADPLLLPALLMTPFAWKVNGRRPGSPRSTDRRG